MPIFHLKQAAQDYAILEKSLAVWLEHPHHVTSLKALAKAAGMAVSDFEALLWRWAGIDAASLLNFLSKARLRPEISSNLARQLQAMPQRRWRPMIVHQEFAGSGSGSSRGQGQLIVYGLQPTPFGMALLAQSRHGLCWLSFEHSGGEDMLAAMQHYWQGAQFEENPIAVAELANHLFDPALAQEPIRLHLCGSRLQIAVWQRLTAIPGGEQVTYSALATALGRRRAVRAVATAVGRNPVSYLVPCHRVWRKSGAVGGYRWGIVRKYAMWLYETAAGAPEGRTGV